MITGYNTDVRHGDTVFHVQTEDKGLANPFIETLVYVGGQVLASQRQGYAQVLSEGKGEREIVTLMDQQHRRTIAAIRSGRLDVKLQESQGLGSRPVPLVTETRGSQVPPPGPLRPAVDRTLDQVILDYLTSEAEQEQLLLMVDGDSQLNLGARAGLAIHTSSSKSGHAISGAHIAVKMISTVSEPRTLVSGETGDDGSLHLSFDIPQLEHGTAALIIVADSAIGTAEIKHLL